jgi:hypothetical protein
MKEAKPTWNLFLDDERNPPESGHPLGISASQWTIARSSAVARELVEDLGLPVNCSLDHDLGGDDTAMVFLKWLANEYSGSVENFPAWHTHSANPVGKKNIDSFMNSWKKSLL